MLKRLCTIVFCLALAGLTSLPALAQDGGLPQGQNPSTLARLLPESSGTPATELSSGVATPVGMMQTCGSGSYQCGYGEHWTCCNNYDTCCRRPNSDSYYCVAQGNRCP
jgi:hypothetical protein